MEKFHFHSDHYIYFFGFKKICIASYLMRLILFILNTGCAGQVLESFCVMSAAVSRSSSQRGQDSHSHSNPGPASSHYEAIFHENLEY